MLENPTLLLLPWAPRPDCKRGIADAASGRVLGFARLRSSRWPSWLGWLKRSALDVFETEDESLVFTLWCPWLVLRGWEVADADEHPVGALRGRHLLDRYDRLLASAEQVGQNAYRFRSPEGYELGRLEPNGADHRLAFGEQLAGDPFARMMLLAAALALTK
jgi:hypothetical protein